MLDTGLSVQTLEQLQNVFRKHPELTEVRLFGSRAMGNYKTGSDIDLAIFGNFPRLFPAALKRELDELPSPYRFDVLDYAQLDQEALKQHIDTYGQAIYGIRK